MRHAAATQRIRLQIAKTLGQLARVLRISKNAALLARQNGGLMAQSSVPGVASGAASLENAAGERLKQWGIPTREIAHLESTGKVRREMEIEFTRCLASDDYRDAKLQTPAGHCYFAVLHVGFPHLPE